MTQHCPLIGWRPLMMLHVYARESFEPGKCVVKISIEILSFTTSLALRTLRSLWYGREDWCSVKLTMFMLSEADMSVGRVKHFLWSALSWLETIRAVQYVKWGQQREINRISPLSRSLRLTVGYKESQSSPLSLNLKSYRERELGEVTLHVQW